MTGWEFTHTYQFILQRLAWECEWNENQIHFSSWLRIYPFIEKRILFSVGKLIPRMTVNHTISFNKMPVHKLPLVYVQ